MPETDAPTDADVDVLAMAAHVTMPLAPFTDEELALIEARIGSLREALW